MNGVALKVLIRQLPKLFGFSIDALAAILLLKPYKRIPGLLLAVFAATIVVILNLDAPPSVKVLGPRNQLHVYPMTDSEEPRHAPAHCRLPSVHESDSRTCAVAPRVASLLSTFSLLAGVTAKTSRSIKPRERVLRGVRLVVWSGF